MANTDASQQVQHVILLLMWELLEVRFEFLENLVFVGFITNHKCSENEFVFGQSARLITENVVNP